MGTLICGDQKSLMGEKIPVPEFEGFSVRAIIRLGLGHGIYFRWLWLGEVAR